MGRGTFLGNEEWRSIPFEGREKTWLEKLCDAILAIQWADAAPGIVLQDNLDPPERKNRVRLAEQGIHSLEDWWTDFCLAHNLELASTSFSTYRNSYLDAYRISALMVALHSGAIVKLCAVLNLISPEHRTWISPKLWHHSERVITAAACVAEESNYHAKLFVSAPASIVTMYGATKQQKEQASLLLTGLDHVKAMGDPLVCEKAARLMLS